MIFIQLFPIKLIWELLNVGVSLLFWNILWPYFRNLGCRHFFALLLFFMVVWFLWFFLGAFEKNNYWFFNCLYGEHWRPMWVDFIPPNFNFYDICLHYLLDSLLFSWHVCSFQQLSSKWPGCLQYLKYTSTSQLRNSAYKK